MSKAKRVASVPVSDIPELAVGQEPDIPELRAADQLAKPFLSPGDESDLVRRTRDGDDSARATLVSAHMPLVRALARAYRNKGISEEDLMQEGYMGLLRAVDRYREGMGTRFSSYATWWVREGMQRALIRSRFIRLPDYLAKSLHAYQGRQEGEESDDTPQTRKQRQQEALGVRDSTMRALEFADIRVSSLDEEIQEGLSRIDQCMGHAAPPEHDYDRNTCVKALRAHLKQLNEKQREVMIYRFGLHGDTPMTLEAVAARLGISREAVRQLQVRALARLRQVLEESGWDDGDV